MHREVYCGHCLRIGSPIFGFRVGRERLILIYKKSIINNILEFLSKAFYKASLDLLYLPFSLKNISTV